MIKETAERIYELPDMPEGSLVPKDKVLGGGEYQDNQNGILSNLGGIIAQSALKNFGIPPQ